MQIPLPPSCGTR
jgi:hypothetical protein